MAVQEAFRCITKHHGGEVYLCVASGRELLGLKEFFGELKDMTDTIRERSYRELQDEFENIVWVYYRSVLLVRICFLDIFLEIAREVKPNRDLKMLARRWLLLQLYPSLPKSSSDETQDPFYTVLSSFGKQWEIVRRLTSRKTYSFALYL